MKPITAGRDFGTSVEVLSGLRASDRVIDSPPDGLSDGDVVRVVDNTAGKQQAVR